MLRCFKLCYFFSRLYEFVFIDLKHVLHFCTFETVVMIWFCIASIIYLVVFFA